MGAILLPFFVNKSVQYTVVTFVLVSSYYFFGVSIIIVELYQVWVAVSPRILNTCMCSVPISTFGILLLLLTTPIYIPYCLLHKNQHIPSLFAIADCTHVGQQQPPSRTW